MVSPKLYAIWESVKQKELFAIRPSPRFEARPKYGTPLGLIVSVVVLGIIVAFSIFSVTRLVTSTRASLVRTTSKSLTNVTLEPFTLTLPFLNDPTYFTVTVEGRSAAPGQRSTKVPVPVTIESNSNLSYGVRDTTGTVAQLFGDCRVGRCSYVRIKVFPCQNATSNVTCKTPDVINSIVDNNYLGLTVFTKTIEGEPVERNYDLSLKDLLSFRQQFFLDLNTEKFYPNYLTTWSKRTVDTKQLNPPVFSIDRLPRLVTGDDTEYCKIDFMLSGVHVTQRRYFQTVLDCIAEIAAFFGAISGIAAIFVVTYNENTFYEKYPKWTDFDRNFEHMDAAKDGAYKATKEEMTAMDKAEDPTMTPPQGPSRSHSVSIVP